MMKNLRDGSLEKRRTDWKFNRTMLCPFLFSFSLSLSLLFYLFFRVLINFPRFDVTVADRWRTRQSQRTNSFRAALRMLQKLVVPNGWKINWNAISSHISRPGRPCGKFSIERPIAYTRICLTMDR